MKKQYCDRCDKETNDLMSIGTWWGDELYGKELCKKCFDKGYKLGDTVVKELLEKKEKVLKEFIIELKPKQKN